MMTGRFDPVAQGETWVWSHDLIADDTGDLMNLDGVTFALNVTAGQPCPLPDYGWLAPPVPGGFFGLFCGPDWPIATLSSGNGVLTAQEGTIVATVPGIATAAWPCGSNRLTLDATRYGETVRLVDMILPVTGA